MNSSRKTATEFLRLVGPMSIEEWTRKKILTSSRVALLGKKGLEIFFGGNTVSIYERARSKGNVGWAGFTISVEIAIGSYI